MIAFHVPENDIFKLSQGRKVSVAKLFDVTLYKFHAFEKVQELVDVIVQLSSWNQITQLVILFTEVFNTLKT